MENDFYAVTGRWDKQTGKRLCWYYDKSTEISTSTTADVAYGMAVSPDGKTVACAGRQDIKLWDALSGKVLKNFHSCGRHATTVVSYSPDGKLIALNILTPESDREKTPSKGGMLFFDATCGKERVPNRRLQRQFSIVQPRRKNYRWHWP